MKRNGFTLVELLVAIGIIALLFVLLAFAIGPTLQSARISSTRTTISQLNDIVQQRMDALSRIDLSGESRAFASRTGLSQKQAEFALRKNLYRQAFPQSPLDLLGFDRQPEGTPFTGGDVAAINNWIEQTQLAQVDDSPYWTEWVIQFDPNLGESPTGVTPGVTNSQAFLFAVTRISKVRATVHGRSYGLPTLDIDSVNTKHIANPPSRQERNSSLPPPAPYFVDEWNSPLAFFPWPTALMGDPIRSVLISGLPPNLGIDPDEPTGMVSFPAFAISGSHPALPFTPESYHHPNTYHTPLIVSAGPDGEMGLQDGALSGIARLAVPSNTDNLVDNITNRQ